MNMSLQLLTLFFCTCENVVMIVLLLYMLICISDLDHEYMNARQCADKLNFWFVAAIMGFIGMSVLFFVSGHEYTAIANIVWISYLVFEVFRAYASSSNVFQPGLLSTNEGRTQSALKVMIILFVLFVDLTFNMYYAMVTVKQSGPPLPGFKKGIIYYEV